jgi:hypothetical protein
MRRLIIIPMVFSISLSLFSQTKMFINKTSGTDSLWLSDIKSIYFKTYSQDTMQRLVAYYPFSGNANDVSGNGNNGMNHGAALTSDRFGTSNSAYHFADGSNISIPELFDDTVSAFTVAVWIMKDNVDNNSNIIFYKDPNQGEAALCINKTTTDTTLMFSVNIETGVPSAQNWYAYAMPDTLKAHTYYFIVGRYIRGVKVELLINGQLMGSTALPNSSSLHKQSYPAVRSAIGIHSVLLSNTYWNGVIDDIRVYNRALSDSEVQSLYHEGGWTGN